MRGMTQEGISFTAAQDQKQKLAKQYEILAEEFKQRLMDFRSVDKVFLDKLDSVQREMAAKTQENMAAMERMQG